MAGRGNHYTMPHPSPDRKPIILERGHTKETFHAYAENHARKVSLEAQEVVQGRASHQEGWVLTGTRVASLCNRFFKLLEN